MKTSKLTKSVLAVVTIVALALPCVSFAQEVQITRDNVAHEKPDYSPFVDQHFPTRVFWGDTHLHTSNSPDARLMGTDLGPEAALDGVRRQVLRHRHAR